VSLWVSRVKIFHGAYILQCVQSFASSYDAILKLTPFLKLVAKGYWPAQPFPIKAFPIIPFSAIPWGSLFNQCAYSTSVPLCTTFPPPPSHSQKQSNPPKGNWCVINPAGGDSQQTDGTSLQIGFTSFAGEPTLPAGPILAPAEPGSARQSQTAVGRVATVPGRVRQQ
jgi:hypothetical protein